MTTSRVSTRSPILAGLRSVVVPGWGELSTTRSRTSWILILISLAMANIAVAAVILVGPVEALSQLFDPFVLLGIGLINIAVALARSVSSVTAWRLAGGRNLLVAVLLGVLVLGPHAALGWVTFQVRDTLVTVFAPTPPPFVLTFDTTTTTTTTSLAVHAPATPTTTPGWIANSDISQTQPIVREVPEYAASPLLGQRLNILLLGGDAGPGRWGLRTDSVMVASINPVTRQAALFGLPRNLGELHLTTGEPVPGKILNEVYGWARNQQDRFPGVDSGAMAVADVATYLTGIPIDYFMLIDLTGFADIVDVFGGVDLNVTQPVYAPLYNTSDGSYRMITIERGEQKLDGGEALAYSRARLGSSDYARMGRQRCVLAALVDQTNALGMFTRLPSILDVVETHVTTNLPIELVPHLVQLGANLDSERIRMVGFGPTWNKGVNEMGQVIPDVDKIRSAVLETLTNPSEAPIPTAEEDCG